MGLIETCVRRPVTMFVIVLLILIAGVVALFNVPVQLTPNVDQPVVTVTTTWFGASPQEVVREIVEEQEEQLKTVNGLREMTSVSREGQAEVRLEFFTGVDKSAALNEVRDKLSQVADYPADVDEPTVESVDSSNRDYIAWLLLQRTGQYAAEGSPAQGWDGEDITALQDFAEDFIKPALERADGVAEVNVLGGREREMQVRLNLEQLAARGITVTQFLDALRDANRDVTAGTITESKRDTSVRVVGQFESPEDVELTVVAYDPAGAPVYVKDVADAVLSFKKRTGWVRSKGEPVLAINAQRETGSNVLEVMDNLKLAIQDVNEDVLAPTNWSLQLNQVYDVTVYIDDAVGQAKWNLVLGAVLAGTVLLVTLRSVGATLTILGAVPVSVVGTFLGMALLGRNLNVISMAGLTFAVGMGVDNAIVVLENIFRHREMGKDRYAAAIDGAKEVWGAIVASTLTNVAVFLPIILIQEEAGQLFRDISVALTISFGFYLFVAPTFIPMLTTLLLRKVPAAARTRGEAVPQTVLGRALAPVGRFQRRLAAAFGDLVRYLTRGILLRLTLVFLFVFVALFGAWMLMPPTDYLPAGNQNLVFGIVAPPPGYSVDEFSAIGKTVEDRLRPWWEAADNPEQLQQLQTQWKQGVEQFRVPALRGALEGQRAQLEAAGLPPEKIAEQTSQIAAMVAMYETSEPPAAIDNFFFVQFGSIGFMGASSADRENVKPLTLLMNEAAEGIPGTFAFNSQSSIFNSGSLGEGLVLRVSGSNNDDVLAAAGALQGALMGAFNTFPQSDPSNFSIGRQEVRVAPNKVRAASAGVSNTDIRNATEVAVDGAILGDYRQAGRSIDLTVVNSEGREDRAREQLPLIPLAAGVDRVIPLSAVADFQTLSVPQQINRTEEQPTVQFTITLPQSVPIGEATAVAEGLVEQMREQGVISPNINVTLSGSADKLVTFLRQFIPLFAMAAVITYLLLAALFENWLHPLTIIMSVPLAMVGGFVGLAAVHAVDPLVKLDVLTMLGFVILVGTIINNPILIVHRALQLIASGRDDADAIAEATTTRVRPIFMSVTTTVAGLAPLVLFSGAGSELYRGLGAVVVGGLLLSTLFTLVLTPTLMSLLLDLSRLLTGRGRRTPSARVRPVEGDSTESDEPTLVLS